MGEKMQTNLNLIRLFLVDALFAEGAVVDNTYHDQVIRNEGIMYQYGNCVRQISLLVTGVKHEYYAV